ncbi:MAG: ABC transporter substrate-binding protein [Pseudomonadota bacterium]
MRQRHPTAKTLVLVLCLSCLWTPLSADSAAPLRLYIDADRGVTRASAEAIRMGVETALAQVGHTAAGRRIDVVVLDHRGNSKRSLLNLRRYLGDPHALAVIGGKQSPPYLRHNLFIQENEILLLLPWSAAGPVTRPESAPNWIFRLSIDDTKAGRFLAQDAVLRRGCKHNALLLVDTGWGRSNRGRITRALQELGHPPTGTHMFARGIGEAEARALVRTISASGADCVIMVPSMAESILLVHSFADLAPHIRISSHWGHAGGNFADVVSYAVRETVALRFLHTCFPFDAVDRGPFAEEIARSARNLFPDRFEDYHTLPASVGFVHAFDVTRLLLAALEQAGLGTDIIQTRRRVRTALETLDGEVQGLMRVYHRPYAPYRPQTPDAHEALGADDLCMVAYGPSNELATSFPER